MHATATTRRFRNLAMIVSILALAACGQGDGPESIANQPATPLPGGGGGGPPFDSGLLINGDFEDGVAPWYGNAANVVNDGGNLVNFADIAVAGDAFNVNLSQAVVLTDGETYTLTFKARSNRNRTLVAGIGLSVDPFDRAATQEVNLTTAWQTYVLELTAAGFDVNSRVLFDMGADTGQVIIDDVSLFAASGEGGGGPINPEAAIYRTAGDEELVLNVDYQQTAFDSGSVIDRDFADDETYSPALSVFSGTGYGANIAQIGFTGFPAGFLTNYDNIVFKVKGMPNLVVFVRLFDGVDAKRISLSFSSYSFDLGDGWYQVSIPVEDFGGVDGATGIVLESDDSSAEQFRMLLTDVGFTGDGTRVPADPGVLPDVSLYDRDGMPDLMIPDDFDAVLTFDSGANVEEVTSDLDFRPALAITTGFGYTIWNAQLAYVGFDAGFATAYETLHFKVKDLSGDVIRVKLLDDPTYVDINVTTSDYSTALGNGWYQVSVPIVDIPGAAAATGLLFETISPPPAESFTYLLTDVGFDLADTGGGGDHGAGTAGVLTETATETTIPVTSITNSIEFGGNNTIADPTSMAIPAFEGNVSLSIEYQDSGSTYGGAVLNFGGVDLTAYDTLNLTIDTSGIPGLTGLTIQIEPPGAGAPGTNVNLLAYTPVMTSGNWSTYSIPLADFGATNFADAANLGFWNPSDAGGLVFGTIYVDDIYFSTESGGGPADHGPGTGGVYTETATESTIPVTSITNSIEFGGNNTIADPTSMAIPAFEGNVSLSIEYQDSGSTYGGAVLNFGGVDLTAYDTLNFTIDTSGIPGLTGLTIQIEPPGAGAPGTNVNLLAYTPVATSGSWSTYAIPLADFGATNFAAASNLGFWNPSDGGGLVFGTIYVDDIYFSTEGGGPADHGPGTGGVYTETATESTITVTSITNSIDFTGNNTPADPNSTAIPAFEGSVVLEIDYQDSGSTFGGALLNFGGVDLTAYDTLNLTIDTSGIPGLTGLTIQIEPPGAGAPGTNVNLLAYTPVATSGSWSTYAIPLADFGATNFAAASNLGFWNPSDGGGLVFGTIYVDDIYFSTEGGGGGGVAGELADNGGFEEAGTLEETGWTVFPNGGSVTVVGDAFTGSSAARLVAAAGQNPLIKQQEKGAGTVAQGDTINVSFRMKGSAVTGGVVFVEFFSENSGSVDQTFLVQPPTFPTADWMLYEFTPTVLGDASRGITLQIAAVCGAVAGCAVDIVVDDISMSVAGGN